MPACRTATAKRKPVSSPTPAPDPTEHECPAARASACEAQDARGRLRRDRSCSSTADPSPPGDLGLRRRAARSACAACSSSAREPVSPPPPPTVPGVPRLAARLPRAAHRRRPRRVRNPASGPRRRIVLRRVQPPCSGRPPPGPGRPGRAGRLPPFVPGWSSARVLRPLAHTPPGCAAPPPRPSLAPWCPALARADGRGPGARRADRIPEPMLAWTRAWQRDTATMRNDAAMIRACGDAGSPLRSRRSTSTRATCCRASALPARGRDRRSGRRRRPDAIDLAARAAGRHRRRVGRAPGHLPWLGDPARAASAIGAFVQGTIRALSGSAATAF